MDDMTGAGEAEPSGASPDTGALLQEGEDLFNRGNYLRAIEFFDRVLAADSVNVKALVLKGRAFGERGTYSEAMVCLKKAIDLDPANADAWFYRGLTEQHMGRYAEADEAYSKAVELHADYSRVWAAKGAALVKMGKYEAAIESYCQALAIDPENTILQQEKKLATMLNNFRVRAETEVQAVKEDAARALGSSGDEVGRNIKEKVIAPLGGAISGIVAKIGKPKKE